MRIKNWWPMPMALLIAVGALYAGVHSHPDPLVHWQNAARWTARIGFPFFIVTYAASSLGRLWPNSVTRTIWRDRRWWGLSFAITHTVHLYAIAHAIPLLLQAPNPPEPAIIQPLTSALAYLLLYLMAFTSTAAAQRKLGNWWRRLHSFGIHWLWLIFATGYGSRLFDAETRLTGLIGTSIALAALGLRIAVYIKKRRQKNGVLDGAASSSAPR